MLNINAETGQPYKGNNQDTLIAAGRTSNVWATFNQWKKLGFSVKKGSKGIKLAKYKKGTKMVKGVEVEQFEVYPFTVFNSEQVEQIVADKVA